MSADSFSTGFQSFKELLHAAKFSCIFTDSLAVIYLMTKSEHFNFTG